MIMDWSILERAQNAQKFTVASKLDLRVLIGIFLPQNLAVKTLKLLDEGVTFPVAIGNGWSLHASTGGTFMLVLGPEAAARLSADEYACLIGSLMRQAVRATRGGVLREELPEGR